MENFKFHNPTKILFGKGQIAELKNEIPRASRILMTFGGGSIKKNGVYDQVKTALNGFEVMEFGGIEPNPTLETLMQAVALVKKHQIDFLLAVGGGSVVDGTKFIAAAAVFEGADPWEICRHWGLVKKALPLASVLTLPATGSEMNSGAVITKKATSEKLAFMSSHVYPRFSILDPTTTFTLPPRQIANGVVDAFVHIAEQYLTFPVEARVQDRFAEGLLKTLIEVGPKTLKEPENYDARANLMWAATMALNGLIGSGVPQDWATHMIGHELTALHGLDHAQSLAVVLPNLLRDQKSAKHAKLLQYARRVWDITDTNEDRAVETAMTRTQEFFASLGVKTKLSDYGVNSSNLPAVVERLQMHGMTRLGEKGQVTLEASRRILESAL